MEKVKLRFYYSSGHELSMRMLDMVKELTVDKKICSVELYDTAKGGERKYYPNIENVSYVPQLQIARAFEDGRETYIHEDWGFYSFDKGEIERLVNEFIKK